MDSPTPLYERPIYGRMEDLKAIQTELRAIGLSADRIFVSTPDHPSETVLRTLTGGIIPGVRSARDASDKLLKALADGAVGINPSSL